MPTQTYEFEGTVKWVKIYEPDEYRGARRWLVNLYPNNEAQWNLFRKSGLGLKAKEDEDGKYIQFRRDVTKKIGDNLVEFTPPFLYDTDGSPLVTYVDENDKPVTNFDRDEKVKYFQRGDRIYLGNGSEVKARVAVFDTSMGKGHRLENIKLVDLIELEGGGRSMITAENMSPAESDEQGENVPATDLSEDKETKTPKKQTTKKTSTKSKPDPDDDLPF